MNCHGCGADDFSVPAGFSNLKRCGRCGDYQVLAAGVPFTGTINGPATVWLPDGRIALRQSGNASWTGTATR